MFKDSYAYLDTLVTVFQSPFVVYPLFPASRIIFNKKRGAF
jgi:hypothetical protein